MTMNFSHLAIPYAVLIGTLVVVALLFLSNHQFFPRSIATSNCSLLNVCQLNCPLVLFSLVHVYMLHPIMTIFTNFQYCNLSAVFQATLSLSCTDINQIWQLISDLILRSCESFISKFIIKKSSCLCWFTAPICHVLNRIHTL